MGIKTGDWSGHVHPASGNIVFSAYPAWLAKACVLREDLVSEELCDVDGLAEAEQRDGGGEAEVPPTRNARWGK